MLMNANGTNNQCPSERNTTIYCHHLFSERRTLKHVYTKQDVPKRCDVSKDVTVTKTRQPS